MAKVVDQSIPSEDRQLWDRIFNPTMDPTTGYNYIVGDYEYGSLLGIRMSKANNNKQGTEYPKISEEQADVRCRLTKASRWASEQLESGGVLYPETGPRDKSWWYDNIPIGGCYWNDYAIYEAQPHLDYHRTAPWALSNTLWICSTGNHRLEKWNGGSMSFLDSTTGGAGAGETFGEITRAATDDNYIYVCDATNNKIHILNKDTLAYVKNFSQTTGDVHVFSNPYDIAVGEFNLFIIEYQANVAYVVNKDTFELVNTISLVGSEDWDTPRARGITIDKNIIAVADYWNGFVKIYSRTSFSYLGQITQRGFSGDPALYATAIVSDGQFIYCLDPFNLSTFTLSIGGLVVVNENTFVDESTGGIGLSGDLVFIMGDLTETLYKTVRPNMGINALLNNPGTNPGEFAVNKGVCGPPAYLWNAC